MYVLVFFVPLTHLEAVKNEVFSAGGGAFGEYSNCCFESPGTGQFLPLASARPYLGSSGTLERVREMRVEMVVPDEHIGDVVTALTDSHPYEMPAFHYYRVHTGV